MTLRLSAALLALSLAGTLSLRAEAPVSAADRAGMITAYSEKWKAADSPEASRKTFEDEVRALSFSDDVRASALMESAMRTWPKDTLALVEAASRLQPVLASIFAATAAGIHPELGDKIIAAASSGVRQSPQYATSGSGKEPVGKQPVGKGVVGKQPVPLDMIDQAIAAAVKAAIANGAVGGWLWTFPGRRPDFVGSPIEVIFRPIKFPTIRPPVTSPSEPNIRP